MAVISKSIENYISNVIAIPREDISSAMTSRQWLLERVRSEIARRQSEPTLYLDQPTVGGQSIGDGVGTANPNYK